MSVRLICGDCLDVLRGLDAASVEAVITDPPYGETDFSFDTATPNTDWAVIALRVAQINGYLATFGSIEMLGVLCQLWSKRFSCAWLKPNGTPRSHNAKKPPSQYEPLCVYAHPQHRVSGLTYNRVTIDGQPWRKVRSNNYFRRNAADSLDRNATSSFSAEGYVQTNEGFRYQTDVLVGNSKPYMRHDERTEHPTQKPVDVMRTLVEWLTEPGDVVLDPFMGSGTTGVACVQTGRSFIGVEIDRTYFEIAEKRIAEAQAQLALPLVPVCTSA